MKEGGCGKDYCAEAQGKNPWVRFAKNIFNFCTPCFIWWVRWKTQQSLNNLIGQLWTEINFFTWFIMKSNQQVLFFGSDWLSGISIIEKSTVKVHRRPTVPFPLCTHAFKRRSLMLKDYWHLLKPYRLFQNEFRFCAYAFKCLQMCKRYRHSFLDRR